MSRTCRLILIAFGLLYLAAFGLFLIGTFGWFGSPTGPLAGVFLVPLGLPWNLGLDRLSPTLRTVAATAAPSLNLLVLWAICRWRATR